MWKGLYLKEVPLSGSLVLKLLEPSPAGGANRAPFKGEATDGIECMAFIHSFIHFIHTVK